ncbi:MAG TPA: DUF2934 domain-containing protein [Verrucomicrobiae bacterium]|nr:DUF2934 domain-containing protein [Verrucomicrobiae bacterium]
MNRESNSSSSVPLGLAEDNAALRERIEKRAYHLWLSGGGRHGEHLSHWLQAESEVLKALKQDEAERALSRKTKPTVNPRSSRSLP